MADAEPNLAQRQSWDGSEGEHWVSESVRYDAMTEGFGLAVLEAAQLVPGERVLDVGCGTGQLTVEAGRRVSPAGSAVGIDVSSAMLAKGDRRASDEAAEIRFVNADAQLHAFQPGEFDKAISRFGVMFFDNPEAAFTNLARSLVDGGRLVFVAWQGLLQSEWIMVPGAAAAAHVGLPAGIGPGDPGPYGLADAERTAAILDHAGFTSVDISEIVQPMRIGSDLDDAMNFIRSIPLVRDLLAEASPENADAAIGAAREALGPHVTPEGVVMENNRAWLVIADR